MSLDLVLIGAFVLGVRARWKQIGLYTSNTKEFYLRAVTWGIESALRVRY
jgi:hypothetical protein